MIATEAARWAGFLCARMSELGARDSVGFPTRSSAGSAEGPGDTGSGPEGEEEGAGEEETGAELRSGQAQESGFVGGETAAAWCDRKLTLPFNGHHLVSAPVEAPGNGSITFCHRCGAYSWKRIGLLSKKCDGPHAPGLSAQRSRLRAGVFPCPGQGEWRLGRARPLSVSEKNEIEKKLGRKRGSNGSAAAASMGNGDPAGAADRDSTLACYGVTEADVPGLVAWVKRLRQSKKEAKQSQDGGMYGERLGEFENEWEHGESLSEDEMI